MLNLLTALLPFILTAFGMFATPGPNNMMLTYSGAKFGVWKSLPHVLGISFGCLLFAIISIMGVNELISQWPFSLLLIKIIGSAWLFYISYNMLKSKKISKEVKEEKPMKFIAALLFQFSNPKAYVGTLAISSAVLSANTVEQNYSFFALVFFLLPIICFLSCAPWVVAGNGIRQFLSSPQRWKVFSWAMAGLMASCAILLWI